MSSFNKKFWVKWNDFQQNITTSYKDLRETEDFSDVTLLCEENQQIEAHGVILSACSPFLRNILKKTKHSHPMIYMRGMKTKHLTAILDFMYHGEANIHQDDLDDFFVLAEELKLSGLESKEENLRTEQDFEPKKEVAIPDDGFDIVNKNIVKEEVHEENSEISSLETRASFDELDKHINTMMGKAKRGWNCKICGKVAKKNHLRQHIEAHHIEGWSHSCDQCEQVSRSRQALTKHKQTRHRV